MSEPLPLAAGSERLRRKPGRPRRAVTTPLAPAPDAVSEQIRRLFDLGATATYLGVSGWTVRDLEAAGILKRVHIPTANGGDLRKLLFAREDLDRLIESWKDRA